MFNVFNNKEGAIRSIHIFIVPELIFWARVLHLNSITVSFSLTAPSPSAKIIWLYGPVAQLGARVNRTDEVAGSNPARSTHLVDGIPLCGKIPCTQTGAYGAVGSASQWH